MMSIVFFCDVRLTVFFLQKVQKHVGQAYYYNQKDHHHHGLTAKDDVSRDSHLEMVDCLKLHTSKTRSDIKID